MKNIKKEILKNIKALDDDSKITYYFGDMVFKKLVNLLLPTCIEIVGLPDDIINRIMLNEVMDYKTPITRRGDNDIIYQVPWHLRSPLIKGNSEESDKKMIGVYIITWCYYENWHQMIKMGNPLMCEFYETMIVGLLHELRHVYQYEHELFGIDNKTRNHRITKEIEQSMEDDAVKFAFNAYNENQDKISPICQEILSIYLRMYQSGIIRYIDLLKL